MGERLSEDTVKTLLDDLASVAEPATETLNSNLFWRFQARRLMNGSCEKHKGWHAKADDCVDFADGVARVLEAERESLLSRIWTWLTQPPLTVRLLQDQIFALTIERDHLQDVLTQAYERSGIVPRQPEHRGPEPPPIKQRQSFGEMQSEYLEEEARRYAQWEEEERLRIEGTPPS